MSRYFHAENASRTFRARGMRIQFQVYGTFAGTPRGIFKAERDDAAQAVALFANDPTSGVKEITESDYEIRKKGAAPQTAQRADPDREVTIAPLPTGSETCIVELGRYGDIINILPIAQDMFQRNMVRPWLLVAQEFVDLLDGVGYVRAEAFPGSYHDLAGGKAFAQQRHGANSVLVTQVYGRDYSVPVFTDSFAKESWRVAGYLDQWGKLPLEFDNRRRDREMALVEKWIGKSAKPTLLLNIDASWSSPYPHKKTLASEITDRWSGDFHIVNLANVRAERLYDLLGLFDEAALLVSIDTAGLHLAAASAVPTIALIQDRPNAWFGTAPRCNCIHQQRYSDRAFSKIHKAIEKSLHPPKMIHVFSETPRDQRTDLAQSTWQIQYLRGPWERKGINDASLGRLFDDKYPSTMTGQLIRRLPYVRDLIDTGKTGAADEDIIVLTNSDVAMAPSLTQRLQARLNNPASPDACFSYRRDFPSLTRHLSDAEVRQGHPYVGCDLFAFRVSWWKNNRVKFPDMLIGAEAWDWVLRVLIQETNPGKDVAFTDLVYHERHRSVWEQPQNKTTLASQIHNRSLAKAFLIERGIYRGELG